MSLPEHLKHPSIDQAAVAPYNFVPLPERAVPAEPQLGGLDRYDDDRLTGRIDCTLTTWSPLYVRCGIDAAAFARGEEAKDRADFFFTEDRLKPVIPGSSLRGMLRSLVEVAGYGRMDRVPKRGLVYRVVGDRSSLGESYRKRLMYDSGGLNFIPLMKAGFLEQRGSGWEIRPAQVSADGSTFARIEESISRNLTRSAARWEQTRNAWRVFVQIQPIASYPHNQGRVRLQYAKVDQVDIRAGTGLREGVLVHTGPMQRKHMQFVFNLPDQHADPLPIDDAMLHDFREQISQEQRRLLGSEGALNHGQPIFYLEEHSRLVFFGHSMMLRLPYLQSPDDFVPGRLREGGIDAPEVDLAEAIFGYVRPEARAGDQARAGRVSVGDAQPKDGQDNVWYSDDPITPHILGGPKPTTFQHYLVQRSNDRRALAHYASNPGRETVLRGHKLYWHKNADPDIAMSNQRRAQASETQLTAIRPVRAGLTFTFRLWYENLSQVELGALLWVLQLAADPAYRLSLGMGKPLGMGAISLSHTAHRYKPQPRYARMIADDGSLADGVIPLAEDEARSCIEAFERHVLAHSGEGERGYAQLSDTLRMRCLQALLSWPGPSPDRTRYMEIERDTRQPFIGEDRRRIGKINEYLDRPVLPSPLDVHPSGAPSRPTRTAPVQKTLGTGSTLATPVEIRTVPGVGAVFAGKVIERDDSTILISVPGHAPEAVLATLQIADDTPNWCPGNLARVEVTGVEQRGERTILVVRRAPKAKKS